MIELTKKEEASVRALKRVAKGWPKSLWLFSASGTLCVMKYKSDGTPVMTKWGGVDQDYIVDTIYIPNDGGDW